MSSNIDLFNAARRAGLPPLRACRYVHHVRWYEATGRKPMTPEAAAFAASVARRPVHDPNGGDGNE